MAITHEATQEWERMQRADHDTLIRVEALMNQIALEIKEFKDGLRTTILDHDTRLKVLEKINEQFQISEIAKETQNNAQWRRDFETRYKTIVMMAGFTGAVITFLIGVVSHFFGWLK